ncbi:alpha/beta hydrolase [Bacteroidota bacterium]
MKQILLFTLITMVYGSYAQESEPVHINPEDYKWENTEKFILKSDVLSQEKEIYVSLPENFNDSTKYPVVLVLEGEILFETFAPLTRLMAEVNEIPECLVVGIPLYNKHLEYAPKISKIPESGNADKMLEFYKTELFPVLEANYNCNDQRILWAHSGLGGIFCTYLLVGPDRQFSGILSSSPNLKFLQEDYLTKENVFESVKGKGKLFYYLTFGSNEDEAYMGRMFQQTKELKERLENEAPENLVWKYRLYEGNNHFTNAIETYMDGLILYFNLMD